MKIFLIKDKLTNMPAGLPFFSYTRESAIRDCLIQFRDHPNVGIQFDLFEIGSYDEKLGIISDNENFLVCNLSNGQEFIDKILK